MKNTGNRFELHQSGIQCVIARLGGEDVREKKLTGSSPALRKASVNEMVNCCRQPGRSASISVESFEAFEDDMMTAAGGE